MGLEALLEKHKAAIVNRWFDSVIDTYPADTSPFLKQQRDPFANPVGNTTRTNLIELFQELIRGTDHSRLMSLIDPIIRMRATQGFTPSQAIGFITFLKGAVREQIVGKPDSQQMTPALLQFEDRIDSLSLIAFDIYMNCRETLFRIMADHEQNRTLSALKRAGLVADSDSS
jgi:hypothetical protein